MPAETCKEIKQSEEERDVNGNYWFHFLEIEKILLTYLLPVAWRQRVTNSNNHNATRQDKTMCDVNACVRTIKGLTVAPVKLYMMVRRQGKASHGKERQGKARRGKARQGKTRQ